MLQGRLLVKQSNAFQEPMINVTPLIDVVFVLLISFIIVAPLLEKDSVELASSGGISTHSPVRPQQEAPISIHVRRDNSILVSGKLVRLDDLLEILTQLKQRYPTAHPQVLHDKRASFGTYQSIKNCIELAGFSEMDILLSPS